MKQIIPITAQIVGVVKRVFKANVTSEWGLYQANIK